MEIYDEFAWLYDAAFSWDVAEEVDWLLDRLGPGVDAVLEPACGSGRMLEALVRRGVRVAGFDRSRAMLERARARFGEAGLAPPLLAEADLAGCQGLELAPAFGGAVLPVGTFAYLPSERQALAHLRGMAGLLAAGARYLVQLELRTLEDFQLRPIGPTTCWDTPHPRGTVRCAVFGRAFDPVSRIETEVSRFEILDGPDAGLVHESEHRMRVWDWETWAGLIAASAFRQVAAWDGNARDRPPLELGPGLEGRPLVWHELLLASRLAENPV